MKLRGGKKIPRKGSRPPHERVLWATWLIDL
jgi:hypothetical protein